MHYYFVDQIERKILELLLIELLEYCKTFSLIWRNEFYDRSYKKYHDELNQISEKINFASRKADSSVVTKNDLKKMNNLQKFYRNIPKEKNADKYAIENMPQYLEKYLEND